MYFGQFARALSYLPNLSCPSCCFVSMANSEGHPARSYQKMDHSNARNLYWSHLSATIGLICGVQHPTVGLSLKESYTGLSLLDLFKLLNEVWLKRPGSWGGQSGSGSHPLDFKTMWNRDLLPIHKITAYGQHWISQCVRIVATVPIFFFNEEKKLFSEESGVRCNPFPQNPQNTFTPKP